MIIDAHFHLWDPAARCHSWLDGLPRIRRPFRLADYAAACAPVGVSGGVLVQVLADATETEDFLALASDQADGVTSRVAGVVGWADLNRADLADEISRLRSVPGGSRLVGLRHLVQDEPDPGWLDRPDVRRGLRAVGAAGLTFDLLVRPVQLPAALRAARDLGEVRFVLDHGGKPEIAAHRMQPWRSLTGQLAALPNVSCKLSGLVTEAATRWTDTDVLPYADWLLKSFGPQRLMFGSDWPVCLLAADYSSVLGLVRVALDGRLSKSEQEAVLYANAVSTYRLPPVPASWREA